MGAKKGRDNEAKGVDAIMLFLKQIKMVLPDIKNIFEVGAHRGYDVLELEEHWPEANIYAFEADPFNYEICKNKFEDNPNIHTFHMAVTDVTAPVVFNRFYDLETIPDDQTFVGDAMQNTGQGSILPLGDGMKEIFGVKDVTEKMEVYGTSLLDFCKDREIDEIDALFMDVQGAEAKVLQGCQEMIRTVKVIALEWSHKHLMYEGETDFMIIKHALEQQGFFEAARVWQLQGISGDSLFLRTGE